MIGIHTQNKQTEEQLILLLKGFEAESYQPDHAYTMVLWLENTKMPQNAKVDQVICLKDIALPLSQSEWIEIVKNASSSNPLYENDFFCFDAQRRFLVNKKKHHAIPLTEKENDFLLFLLKQPDHQASKDLILQKVWKYKPTTQTHTLESHLYALKQKLGKDADKLVQNKDGLFILK